MPATVFKLLRLCTPLLFSLSVISPLTFAEGEEDNAAASLPPLEKGTRVEPTPEAYRVADLAKSISPETETIWLSLEDGSQHLSLYHPASEAEPLGGVVLMPDKGMHADWPVDAHPLRLFLTDAGWQTLSLQLPPLATHPIPERTLPVKVNIAPVSPDGEAPAEAPAPPPAPLAAPANEPPTDTPDEPDASADVHKQLISLGRNELAQKGSGLVVYLGIGQSAITALEMASEVADENIATGILLFNAMQPLDRDAPNMLELLAKVRVPIIDVYTGPPRSLSEFEAPPKQRARVAKRHGLDYIQRRLSDTAPVGVHKQRWFSQQISGLLLKHIHAPLVEKAELLDNVQEDNTPRFEQPPGTPPPQAPRPI